MYKNLFSANNRANQRHETSQFFKQIRKFWKIGESEGVISVRKNSEKLEERSENAMNTMQKFFNLYEPDSYLCVGIENNGSWEYSFKKAKEIAKTNYNGKTNVFFTPNTLGYRYDKEKKKSYIWKDRKHLQELNCLYVDIDFKDADEIITVEEFMEYARYHILGSEVPEPTMINNSGHGVHMYWMINPISYRGNLEKWESAQNYIYEVFAKFGADKKVCGDRVRLLRMCDTINKKENSEVKSENISFSGIVYNFDDILKEYVKDNIILFKKPDKPKTKRTEKENKKENKKEQAMPIHIFSRLYRERIRDLENLLLNHRDYDGSGRECILFLYRYYQCHMNQDTQKALESTLELNSRLSYPLPKTEVTRATKSAEMYYEGSQLNWRNHKIIDFLSIKENEMGSMRTLINHAVKIERKKARDRRRYLAKLQNQGKLLKKDEVVLRQQSVYMLLQEGKDRYEICSILNISKSTYYNDKKVIETEEWKKNIEEMETVLAERPVELLKTGTDDCIVDMEKVAKNSHFKSIPKNSAPVIIPSCNVSFRQGEGNKKEKPPD